MCNYRMDMAAKDLARWNRGLGGEASDDKIKKEVESLF